ANDLDRLCAIRSVREERRRARIEGRAARAARWDGERRHVAPVRADRLLHPVRHGYAVLAHYPLELQRLPAIRIDDADAALRDNERWIHRFVVRRRVSVRLVRTVLPRSGEELTREAIADGRRRVAIDARGVD